MLCGHTRFIPSSLRAQFIRRFVCILQNDLGTPKSQVESGKKYYYTALQSAAVK